MCGRFTQFSLPEELERYFEIAPGFDFPPPRYNVAPGTQILAVRAGAAGRPAFAELHWGLLPSWAKDRKLAYRTINARAETVAEKPAFRSAFKRRRCLIPANGFYEWKATEHGKQPYYIQAKDERPLAFAGLWEMWTDPETGEALESGTIIVTAANSLLSEIHDRMPVILAPEDFETWLSPSLMSGPVLPELLKPCDSGILTAHPVSTRVNKPVEDDPSLIEPLGAD